MASSFWRCLFWLSTVLAVALFVVGLYYFALWLQDTASPLRDELLIGMGTPLVYAIPVSVGVAALARWKQELFSPGIVRFAPVLPLLVLMLFGAVLVADAI